MWGWTDGNGSRRNCNAKKMQPSAHMSTALVNCKGSLSLIIRIISGARYAAVVSPSSRLMSCEMDSMVGRVASDCSVQSDSKVQMFAKTYENLVANFKQRQEYTPVLLSLNQNQQYRRSRCPLLTAKHSRASYPSELLRKHGQRPALMSSRACTSKFQPQSVHLHAAAACAASSHRHTDRAAQRSRCPHRVMREKALPAHMCHRS